MPFISMENKDMRMLRKIWGSWFHHLCCFACLLFIPQVSQLIPQVKAQEGLWLSRVSIAFHMLHNIFNVFETPAACHRLISAGWDSLKDVSFWPEKHQHQRELCWSQPLTNFSVKGPSSHPHPRTRWASRLRRCAWGTLFRSAAGAAPATAQGVPAGECAWDLDVTPMELGTRDIPWTKFGRPWHRYGICSSWMVVIGIATRRSVSSARSTRKSCLLWRSWGPTLWGWCSRTSFHEIRVVSCKALPCNDLWSTYYCKWM